MLLYSAILSRGIENTRKDMDEPTSQLIGMHSYCTQDMVNLLLTGRAVSNVHDGDIRLGDDIDGGTDSKVLKGLAKQGTIGYLSLFEHYDSIKVHFYFELKE